MINKNYLPEGTLINEESNKEYLSSLNGLERAFSQGIILESIAQRCDSNLKLTVSLGEYTGYIEREDAQITYEGEQVKDIAVITRVGKPICFKIRDIEYTNDGVPKIKLSRRAAQYECINNKLSKLCEGDIIESKITHLEQFGAFVDIGCGISSLLSIDCISVSRISHPRDRFSVGDNILCIVKKNEQEGKRIYVTHKELLGSWEENVSAFAPGQTVTGIVRSIEDYGIFVELTPNLAGLAEYKDGISVGQTATVFIKNIIPERMKIKLVIIDSYLPVTLNKKPIKYFINSDYEHIDSWKYSPECSQKNMETVFIEKNSKTA